MKISWIFSDQTNLDPTIDIRQIKNIGSMWGSWRTWRACQTDNIVCHDLQKADQLIKQNFQAHGNFYISNSAFLKLDRPLGVKLYEGEFVHEVDCHEEIVCMHLAGSTSDIVLLMGFDLTEKPKLDSALAAHKFQNYRQLIKQAIANNKNTQWVLIDHPEEVCKTYKTLDNLTKDSLTNVLKLLV